MREHGIPRVVVVSPFAGRGPWPWRLWDKWRNICYARKAMDDCFRRGEAPFVSHLLYPQVLRDSDRALRRIGMQAAYAWFDQVDLVVVYADRGSSPGMESDIAHALQRGLPTETRCL